MYIRFKLHIMYLDMMMNTHIHIGVERRGFWSIKPGGLKNNVVL